MKIQKLGTNRTRIQVGWEHDRSSQGNPVPLTGDIHIEIAEYGTSVSATGGLPPEGIQALKDAIAVAEAIQRHGIDL